MNALKGFRKWNGTKISLLSGMLIIIMLMSSAIAAALGVAPSVKVVDYDSEGHDYAIRVINNEREDKKVMIYAQGELADYAIIGNNILSLKATDYETPIIYRIKLAANLTPGTHKLDIVIVDLGNNIDTDKIIPDKTVVFSTIMVVHQLKVNVPYPGTFAEGQLYISEGNVNDTVTFSASVINKGTNDIHNINGEIVIKGPTNEEIARVRSNSIDSISSNNADKLVANWKADVNAGVYYAEFIVNYDDKQFVLRKTFMVGNYNVEIKDIKVNNFKLGTIAKFDVGLLSRWNQPIQNVFGELYILDPQGNVLTSFKTNPIELKQLTTSAITGYWDTKDVKVGNYDVKVVVYYADKASERLFRTVVGIDSIEVQDISTLGNVVASKGQGSQISVLFILVAISIVLNIGLFIYFKFLRRKKDSP